MALHIVNEESLGGRLGSALGGGISGLIQNLVQQKAEQMQQAKQEEQSRNINKILGLGLSSSPSSSSSSPASGGLEELFQQPHFQETQMPQNAGQPSLQEAMNPLQNPAFRKLQEQQQGANLLQQNQLARQSPNIGRAPSPAGQVPGLPMQQPQPQGEPTIKGQLEDLRRRKQALGSLNLPLKESKDIHEALQKEEDSLRKHLSQQERVSDKKQARIDAETLPYYEKVKKEAESADEMNMRIDQYEGLLDTGKVSGNVFLTFLDELGNLGGVTGAFGRFVTAAATNTETQVAKKLAADFMIGAKDVIGSQMPVAEMQMFMQRVPNLMQTIEGQRAILRNFKAMANMQKARDGAMEKIIASNGDERPRHLQSKVSKEMESYKSNMRRDFKDSIKLINSPKSFSIAKPKLPAPKSIKGFNKPEFF